MQLKVWQKYQECLIYLLPERNFCHIRLEVELHTSIEQQQEWKRKGKKKGGGGSAE